jgi:hypothetical protein
MRAVRRPVLVIAARSGRLANRLILFANFIAFAEEHRYRLINFTFHSYAHLFESTCHDIYCQYPPPSRRSWFDRLPGLATLIRGSRLFYNLTRSAGALNDRWPVWGNKVLTFREPHGSLVSLEDPEIIARFADKKLVFLFGWTFRAPTLVERQADRLRDYFRLRAKHALASQAAVERLRQQAEIVVGVHIRHEDYKRWRGGKYYFPIERYCRWMRQMTEQFPGRQLAFLVSSDEPRQEQEFPGLKVRFAPGIAVQDLYALAQCDYILGPVSSFSQWASFYGNVPLLHLRNTETPVERSQFRVSFLQEVPM